MFTSNSSNSNGNNSGEISASPTEDREFHSILSPPGNYLSPASLDSGSSFTSGNFDSKNCVNIQSPLTVINGISNKLEPLYHPRTMGSTDISTSKQNEAGTSTTTSPNTNHTSPTNHSNKTNLTTTESSDSVDKSEKSSLSNANNNKGSIVKRKYSRNGCTECKRRRMKCDETKPTCWQCARLNRECVYILNSKNKKRKPSTKAKAKIDTTLPLNTAAATAGTSTAATSTSVTNTSNSASPVLSNVSTGYVKRESLQLNDQNIMSYTPEGIVSSPTIQTPQLKSGSTTNDNKVVDVPNLVPLGTMDGYDANLLMQNLNDIVNMKLNDSFILNENLKNFDLPDLDIPELLPTTSPHVSSVPISFLVNNVIQFNIKITSFKLGVVHDEYLRIFYNDCLDSIAPFFQDQGNPLRDILLSFARNESYLLSAILAIGASIAHRKSNYLEDEKRYCAYLSHCLSLLGDQFQNETNVLNKIEPIILTVILLAWDCINTMNSQWRSHLKGVTDLFKKITAGNSSKVLNVAKCWFKVVETFASISTVLGGSLVEEDLDIIFDPYDYQYVDSLKFLNIMTPLNEFNLLRGHKEDFDLVIKEVIRALNAIRSSEKSNLTDKGELAKKDIDYLLWTPKQAKGSEPVSYFKTQKILVEIDRQLEYEFISKTGIIPNESQSHPDNSHIDDNAIDVVTLRNGEKIAISWYDISHQTQVLSFLLIVLLKLLGVPKESTIIQQVVSKIMSFFKFLDSDNPPQNSRTCYSNFAVLMAGLNAKDEETRDIVRSYYKLNGNRSRRLTEHNLARLEKVWYGTDKDYKLADQDVLTW